MKTLIVLRHGKAEAHSDEGDFARVLTHRGEEDAHKAGKHIAKAVSTPDLIVSSGAARALSTARIAAKAVDYSDEISIEASVYDASVGDLVDVVHNLPADASSVVLVGHNPGLDGLVHRLAEDPSLAPGLSTASYAQIGFEVDGWDAVDQGSGRIIATFAP